VPLAVQESPEIKKQQKMTGLHRLPSLILIATNFNLECNPFFGLGMEARFLGVSLVEDIEE
jgi:hypothetical protein